MAQLRRLARLLRLGFGGPLTGGGILVLAIVGGLAPVLIGLMIRTVIDSLAHHASTFDGPLLAAAGVVAATLSLAVIPAASDYCMGLVRWRTSLVMQGRLFHAINQLPGLKTFEDPLALDRLRIAQDAGALAPFQALQACLMLCQGVVTLVGFLIALCLIAPVLGLLVVASAVPDIAFQLVLSRMRLRNQWLSASHIRRRLFYAMLHLEEPAAREIRIFGFGAHLHRLMQDELARVNSLDQAVARRQLYFNVISAIVGALAAGSGLLLAVSWALRGQLAVGDIALYLAAVVAVQAGLSVTIQSMGQLTRAEGGFRHFEAVVDMPPDLTAKAPTKQMLPLTQQIEFSGVWFRYASGLPWILQGVDLVLPAHRTVALIGLNGAGKSTLAKLLCRFYDPDRGRITWDGVDIRRFPVEEFRARLSASFQDYMCYDFTLKQNIGLGQLSASDSMAAIERAAGAATADVIAERLPDGYDTMLSRTFMFGEDQRAGMLLSGGEWQRVALARALMKESADVLVLDEPGAGLDAQAEESLRERLQSLQWDPATLLIAHRMSTVRHADLIAVLAQGRIDEIGSHSELIARCGTYAELFQKQARGFTMEATVAS